jgi:hypothetical protein
MYCPKISSDNNYSEFEKYDFIFILTILKEKLNLFDSVI